MKNPIFMVVLALASLVVPPLALLFIPVLLGRLMHAGRMRRVYGKRRR